MQKQVWVGALAVVVVTGSALAMAGGRGHMQPARVIERLDTNADGLISLTEFQAHRSERGVSRFDATDTDGDGNVSRAEMESKLAEHIARDTARAVERFELADLNKDGFVTEVESTQAKFMALDGDGDGYVSAEELSEAQAARHPQRMADEE